MKKTLFILFVIISFLGFAQNPILFEKHWFVESIQVNGVSISIPQDHYNFPFAYIDFQNISSGLISSFNELMKTDCSSGFVAHLSYNSENDGSTSFHFIDFTPSEVNAGCDTQDADMLNFMQTYKSFFSDNINDDFSYFIQDVYGIDHLVISKPNGRIWFTEVFNPDINNDLADNPWFLDKLIIDANEFLTPDYSNSILGEPKIELDFRSYYNENLATATGEHVLNIEQTFSISGCNYSESMLDLYSSDSEFYLYSQSGTLSDCGYSYFSAFNSYHNSFYFNNLPGVFTYTISQNNGVEILVVSNNLGNQAFYSRGVLSVQDNNLVAINIYPNPTHNFISVATELNINNIQIYSFLGQKIRSSKNKIIDVKSLEKGMYLLVLEGENQRTYKQQFYKL